MKVELNVKKNNKKKPTGVDTSKLPKTISSALIQIKVDL